MFIPGTSIVDLPVRIWQKIKIDYGTQCWNWEGRKHKGYGRVSYGGKTQGLHRLINQTPKGLVTDHLCRNTVCCNPDHLESVTPGENIRRGETGQYMRQEDRVPKAHNKFKTHCKRGHELAGDNLYVNPKGERICKTCQRAKKREHLMRKKQAG